MSETTGLPAQEIVRSAWGHADADRNDRRPEVIYASGFIDGEGWISIQTHGVVQPILILGAGQLVTEPLLLLQRLWGGSIQPDKKGMYRWKIQSDRAHGALAEMLPYLLVKKAQAEIGMRYHEQREGRPNRGVSVREQGRVNMARHRARERGETVETPPRPRISSEAIERALAFRKELMSVRPSGLTA